MIMQFLSMLRQRYLKMKLETHTWEEVVCYHTTEVMGDIFKKKMNVTSLLKS